MKTFNEFRQEKLDESLDAAVRGEINALRRQGYTLLDTNSFGKGKLYNFYSDEVDEKRTIMWLDPKKKEFHVKRRRGSMDVSYNSLSDAVKAAFSS